MSAARAHSKNEGVIFRPAQSLEESGKVLKDGEQSCPTVALMHDADWILSCSHSTHTHFGFANTVMHFHYLPFNPASV